MVTLQHAIKIAAPRAGIFHALTDMDAMREWHLGTVAGAIAPGEVLTLTSKPGTSFSWRTERLEPDTVIVQTAVTGSGTSVGKTLTFSLTDLDDGRTQVDLTDAGWSQEDPHLSFCNTHWGQVLHRLKSYVERA